ncbi:MAG: aldehyde ferredoxin oxidoreductase C-terminal domain-containing protein [Chloroflexota bacterium]
MDRLLRVDMSTGKVSSNPVPDEYRGLGGRGLTSTIIAREVDPRAHPLAVENKLVIAPGLLSGTPAACSGRLSIGAKSPLTGGIKESSPGGVAAMKLARLGIAAIIVEELPQKDELYILHVSREDARLEPATKLKGRGNNDTVAILSEEFGDKVGYLSIGQAGEMKLSASSIAATDMDNRPCRHAGRGGLGAVMGSKHLKAIVIDDRGTEPVPMGDSHEFLRFNRMWSSSVLADPATGQGMPIFGSPAAVTIINKEGALPTRNFRFGQFEKVEEVSGKKLRQTIKERGGKLTLPCSPGCVVRCHRTYHGKDGKFMGKSPEYETLWAFGPNLEIGDLDAIAELGNLCNDYGVDTIDTGVAIAMAMEAGLIEFGDARGALELAREIGRQSYLGRIIASGAATAARVFGVARVPVVKGQAMVAYDPRVIKGMGVTEAKSTMGADHGAGYMVGVNLGWVPNWRNVPKLQVEGQVEASRAIQTFQTAMDSTGLCQFTHTPLLNSRKAFSGVTGMLNTKFGWQMHRREFMALGKSLLKMEHEFNLAAGLGPATDRLPLFFYKEPLPPLNSTFDIPENEMAKFYNF